MFLSTSTHKTQIIEPNNQEYPKRLKNIFDPPKQLYISGKLPDQKAPHLAIVGTRLPSNYGRAVIETIVPELAAQGIIIVSGLARGIDSLAHKATLRAHGQTIAVLGSGIDSKSIYPREHRDLAQKIIENQGALISEYPDSTTPQKWHFVARNRIISGISDAILIIEAKKKSGSHITARFGLEQNREVMAVPGPITDSNSFGPNILIKSGACPITCTEDILEILGIETQNKNKKTIKLNPEEELIFNIISNNPIHIDALVHQTKLDITKISSTLSVMELRGIIKNLGGMNYIRMGSWE